MHEAFKEEKTSDQQLQLQSVETILNAIKTVEIECNHATQCGISKEASDHISGRQQHVAIS
jgi:hypothetical protein